MCTCCLASSLSPVYLFCSLARMGSTFLVFALSFRDLNPAVLAFGGIEWFDVDSAECLRSRVPDPGVVRGSDPFQDCRIRINSSRIRNQPWSISISYQSYWLFIVRKCLLFWIKIGSGFFGGLDPDQVFFYRLNPGQLDPYQQTLSEVNFIQWLPRIREYDNTNFCMPKKSCSIFY